MSDPMPGEHGSPRIGVIALSPGLKSVVLVKYPGIQGWQFPSQPWERSTPAEYASVELAKLQLGLAVQNTVCIEPTIQAAGPLPGQITKFLLAFNIQETSLSPASEATLAPIDAAWHNLQQLEEQHAQHVSVSSGTPNTSSNQLAAVLHQLRDALDRFPDDSVLPGGAHQELASLMYWRDKQLGDAPGSKWQGPCPKDYLANWCQQQGLPAPCYNVFEYGKDPASLAPTRFCVTAILPHTGLQITPDAAYRSPVEAVQNGAVLAALYLEGALPLGHPMLEVAPAGNMAKVPHGYVFMLELDDAEAQEAERQRAQRERALQEKVSRMQRNISSMQKRGRLTPEQLANKRAELVEAQRALEASRPGRAQYIPGDGRAAKASRPSGDLATEHGPPPPKKPRAPLSLQQALDATAQIQNQVQALKELCEKCRWQQPVYLEQPLVGGFWVVRVSQQDAGVVGVDGAPHTDRRQAKLLAAQEMLTALRRKVLFLNPPNATPTADNSFPAF